MLRAYVRTTAAAAAAARRGGTRAPLYPMVMLKLRLMSGSDSSTVLSY